jgi:hypothetical protein
MVGAQVPRLLVLGTSRFKLAEPPGQQGPMLLGTGRSVGPGALPSPLQRRHRGSGFSSV